ncbi:helix-turn-helix domain-containing protein [Rhizobium sp. RU36D]|uniref:helix-turn-helix domain-containing protein n=1 Tax=Rhizobium sp. RU36D TaxID=1907415 RepID=UPI0009D86EAC|nr:helix-turn-helix domain-containing protein [Rhizobium sp. RU36D]SMC71980.1 transcriptional regulator, AraC family [Rhizobium sp. RU36D]
MTQKNTVPAFFVYGEPSRMLDVGFVHVETVMERKSVHFGHVAPHQHPQLGQITYWFSGGGTYRIEDRTWNFSAPTLSFVPSSVVHGFTVDESSDAIVVSISDDLLRTLEAQVDLDLTRPRLIAGTADDPAWERLDVLIRMVADEYRTATAASPRLISGLIGVVLSQIAKLGGGHGLDEAVPGRLLAVALRRAIDRHYREDWPVSRYVELLASTPHLVDKAARETFGQTVKDMLMERRLLEAKRLLMFTIRPVEDIGREIGFEDPAYFSRFFRRRTGEAPAAWRRRQVEPGG